VTEDAELEGLREQLAAVETARDLLVRDRQADRARFAVEAEAGRMRFADPADAWSLIDQGSVDFDDGGNPTNVAALLEELVKAKPYLSARAERPAPKDMNEWLAAHSARGTAEALRVLRIPAGGSARDAGGRFVPGSGSGEGGSRGSVTEGKPDMDAWLRRRGGR